MRHSRIRTWRALGGVAIVVALGLGLAPRSAGAAPNPTPNPVHTCAVKLTGALRSYTEDLLHAAAGCRVKVMKNPSDSCVGSLKKQIDNLASDLKSQINGCNADAARALCPLESKTIQPALQDAIAGDGASVKTTLLQLVDDLFVTPDPAGCERPDGVLPSDVRECASRVAQQTEQVAEQLEQCFFSCERANIIAANREPCIDDITGEPLDEGVAECVAKKLDDLTDVAARCNDDEVVALGCPLGARTVEDLVVRLGERLDAIVRDLDVRIFHSDCQANLPGQPTTPVPAMVTLEPSMKRKQVTCGQVIDAEFMEGHRRLSFDSDLDCGPSQTATDGIVIAKSGLIINGRLKKFGIKGPRRSGLRTGAGIRVLSGVSRVNIQNFKTIENFGVGIDDAGDGTNRKIVVRKSTVRRNVVAGIRLSGMRGKIEQVTADKNGIGFDMTGDATKIKGSVAKGSLYEPRIGIRLGGTDRNLDGVILTAKLNTVELNEGDGIVIAEGAQMLRQNTVRSNGGDGIMIEPGATGTRVNSSIVKKNARCIVVEGDANRLVSNTCEENRDAGIVVTGLDNVVEQNKSGKKTDRGNGGPGYVIAGEGSIVYTNQAEANGGAGFEVTATTAQFKANTATANAGPGFDVRSPGNPLETCSAEANAGVEWSIAPGNLDASGNKANGKTIAIPVEGGDCERGDDCR